MSSNELVAVITQLQQQIERLGKRLDASDKQNAELLKKAARATRFTRRVPVRHQRQPDVFELNSFELWHLRELYLRIRTSHAIFHLIAKTAIFGLFTLGDYLKELNAVAITDVAHCTCHDSGDMPHHIHLLIVVPCEEAHRTLIRGRCTRFLTRRLAEGPSTRKDWPGRLYENKDVVTLAHFINTVRYIYKECEERTLQTVENFDLVGKPTIDWHAKVAPIKETRLFEGAVYAMDHIATKCWPCHHGECTYGAHNTDYHYYTRQPYRLKSGRAFFLNKHGKPKRLLPTGKRTPKFALFSIDSDKKTYKLNKIEKLYFSKPRINKDALL